MELYVETMFPESFFHKVVKPKTILETIESKKYWYLFLIHHQVPEALAWVESLAEAGLIPKSPPLAPKRGPRKVRVVMPWEPERPTPSAAALDRRALTDSKGEIMRMALPPGGLPSPSKAPSSSNPLPSASPGSTTSSVSPPDDEDDIINLVSKEVLNFLQWSAKETVALAKSCKGAGVIMEGADVIKGAVKGAVKATGSAIRRLRGIEDEEVVTAPDACVFDSLAGGPTPKRKLPMMPSQAPVLSPQEEKRWATLRGLWTWLGWHTPPTKSAKAITNPIELFFALVADLMVLQAWLAYSESLDSPHGRLAKPPVGPQLSTDQARALWPDYQMRQKDVELLQERNRRNERRGVEGPEPETKCNEEAFRKSHFYGQVVDAWPRVARDERLGRLWCDVFNDMLRLSSEEWSAWPGQRGERDLFMKTKVGFDLHRGIGRIGFGEALMKKDKERDLTRALLNALYEDKFYVEKKPKAKPHHNPLDGFVAAMKEETEGLMRQYVDAADLRRLTPMDSPDDALTRRWSNAFERMWEVMAVVEGEEAEVAHPEAVAAVWREDHGYTGGLYDPDGSIGPLVNKSLKTFREFLAKTAWIWQVAFWWEGVVRGTSNDFILSLGPLYLLALALSPSAAETKTLDPAVRGGLACIRPALIQSNLFEHPAFQGKDGIDQAKLTAFLRERFSWANTHASSILKDSRETPAWRYDLQPSLDHLASLYSFTASATPMPASLTSPEWNLDKLMIYTMAIGRGTCGVQDVWPLLLHPKGTQWFGEVGGDLMAIGGAILSCYLLTPPDVKMLLEKEPTARGECIYLVQLLFAGGLVKLLQGRLPAIVMPGQGPDLPGLDRVRVYTESVFLPIDHSLRGPSHVLSTQNIFRGLEGAPPDELEKNFRSDLKTFSAFIRDMARLTKDGDCWSNFEIPPRAKLPQT